MSTSRRWAAVLAALGLFLAGPATGTAMAAPSPDQATVQARGCILCLGHGPHCGVHLGPGLHLGLWLHL